MCGCGCGCVCGRMWMWRSAPKKKYTVDSKWHHAEFKIFCSPRTFKRHMNTYGSVYVLYTVIYMYKPKRGDNLYKIFLILSPGHISVATLGAKPGETASSGGMYLS